TDRIPMRHPLMMANVDEYWVAELKKNNLLHAIPPAALRLYALPLLDRTTRGISGSLTEPVPPARGTAILQELERKSEFYPEHYRTADWVFARHWYSTWIDVLTRTDGSGRRLVPLDEKCSFGVAKIPISNAYKEREKKKGLMAQHHSGWGEWYLAIQEGSEN